MDTGSIARPAPMAAPGAPLRVDTLASAGAVRTDLPPDASVQQPAAVEAVRFDPTDGAQDRAKLDAALRDMIDRRITIEPKTREVVYQTVDKESGEVIRQIPDEALLRLRAYGREMRDKIARDNRGAAVERVA